MKKWLLIAAVITLLLTSSVYARRTDNSARETETESPTAETETESPAAETETESPAVKTETESPAAETEAEDLSAQRSPMTMSRRSVWKIMNELGDKELRSTRKFLKDGGVLEKGYRGDAGIGLQKLLVEFGCDIAVDGAVGAKTIDALHQVQERFGIEPTDKVDFDIYDTLIPLLLLTRGEESDEVDLKDFYDSSNKEGCYEYLRGCALAGVGKYYSAKEAFENSDYEGSEERAAACAQELPDSGEIWRNPDIPGSDCALTFTVYGPEDSSGMCFQMFNMEDELVSEVFVRGSGSATAHVPAGTYHIRDGSGSEWYGRQEMFGPYGSYEYLTFSEDPDTEYDAVLDYGTYELSINVSEIAEDATSVGSSGVGWNEYFGDIGG